MEPAISLLRKKIKEISDALHKAESEGMLTADGERFLT